MHLLWLGVGTEEPARMKDGIKRLHASLDDAHIKHVFYESPGTSTRVADVAARPEGLCAAPLPLDGWVTPEFRLRMQPMLSKFVLTAIVAAVCSVRRAALRAPKLRRPRNPLSSATEIRLCCNFLAPG